jgi:hypothetical protein
MTMSVEGGGDDIGEVNGRVSVPIELAVAS